jgi:L-lactate dehydrogenase complex protein LldG
VRFSDTLIRRKSMNAREQILSRLRENTSQHFDMPQIAVDARVFDDPVSQFVETATTTAGAKVIFRKAGENLNQKIHEAYPQARTIASNVPGVKADINPDTVENAQALDGTDVGVVRGGVACAENACIWIPQTMKEKVVCFISECLVIVVSAKNIVSNMHEAYDQLTWNDYGFGTFISGPSKTADIEQALVYGAQAAKSVTIIIEEE